MADLLLHDQGWLSLPAELRQHLGLRTGDRLQLEMIDGGLRLRPAGQVARAEAAPPAQAVPAEPAAKPGRGRPRKQVQSIEQQAELPLQPVKVQPEQTAAKAASTGKLITRGLLPKLKVGGRRKSEPAGTA